MEHFELKLADRNKLPSSQMASMLWKIITREVSTKDFEQWVYTNEELREKLTEKSFLLLASEDYRNAHEVSKLRRLCFDFACTLPLDCLCITFPHNMIFSLCDVEDFEGDVIRPFIDSLDKLLIVESFTGRPENDFDWWSRPAEVCQCHKCGQYYLKFLEEHGPCYYILKLQKQEADIILSNPNWPNKKWPQRLSSWEQFKKIKFISWNGLYCLANSAPKNPQNIMSIYQYM